MHTGTGKWKFLVGVRKIRQVYLSFMYTLDANELEIRIPTGQIFNNFCLLSGEEFMQQTHSVNQQLLKYAYDGFTESALLDLRARLLTPCKPWGTGSKWSLTSIRKQREVCSVYSTCLWKCAALKDWFRNQLCSGTQLVGGDRNGPL